MGGEKESNKDSRERERENSGRIREFLQDPAYSCNVLFLYFYQASVIVSASLFVLLTPPTKHSSPQVLPSHSPSEGI